MVITFCTFGLSCPFVRTYFIYSACPSLETDLVSLVIVVDSKYLIISLDNLDYSRVDSPILFVLQLVVELNLFFF